MGVEAWGKMAVRPNVNGKRFKQVVNKVEPREIPESRRVQPMKAARRGRN